MFYLFDNRLKIQQDSLLIPVTLPQRDSTPISLIHLTQSTIPLPKTKHHPNISKQKRKEQIPPSPKNQFVLSPNLKQLLRFIILCLSYLESNRNG